MGREGAALLAGASERHNPYLVEVSGWDKNENFFVEKTELHWSDQSDKHVLLLRPIASGALVFLRLLDPMSADRTHPVPYRAELCGTAENGQRQVRLISARPGE